MNERYKFQFNVHVVGLSIVIAIVVITVMVNHFTKSSPFDVIFIICIFTSIFGVINNLFTYYSIEERGIRLKSIIRCIDLDWKEINCIKQQPAGKYVSISIGLFGRDKKISITPWTKNYKELLRLIVNVCRENDNITIDPTIYKIIEDQQSK